MDGYRERKVAHYPPLRVSRPRARVRVEMMSSCEGDKFGAQREWQSKIGAFGFISRFRNTPIAMLAEASANANSCS
jgi:hypothetical protein